MANQGLFAAPLISLVIAASTSAQTPQPVAQSWSGWAQCQITIQAPGYSHNETHLWTITGAGTRNANMEIYPTSWTVTGNGSLQRVNGPTTVSAQWTINGTLPNVTIGTTLHLDRITVQRWTNHGPARSGLTGTEISTTNGVARPRAVILDVQQWAFPGIETGTTSTRATGSNTLPFDGLRGPMNPPSGAMGTAACTWDFARGGVSPSSPPPSTTTAPTTSSSGAPVSGGVPTGNGGSTPSAPGSPSAAGAMVSLVFPNGGERLGAGDGAVRGLVRFTYGSATTQQRFDVDLSTDAGGTWTSLRRGDQPSLVEGIFLLNLPLPRTSTNRALVRVTPTDRPQAAGVSNAPFTIVEGSIKVTVPAPLVTGQSATISWTHDLPADQRRFRVRLVRPNLPESEYIRWLGEVVATGSSESFTFTVPGPATTQAQLTVITPDDLFAAFSPLFNIDASSTPSSSTGGGATGTGGAPGGAAGTSDLAISFFGGSDPSGLTVPSSWPTNGTARYGLGVVNLGSVPADGARITVPASAGLTKTAVSCGGQQGAQSTNPTVTQIESGFAIATLPPGSFVTCQILATVTATAGSSVTMAVSVTPPGGVSDPNSGNNTATNTLPIVSSSPPGGAPSSGGGAGSGGASAGGGAGSSGVSFRAFTTSGGFVVPTGVTTIGIELWGAGGGGAAGASGGFSGFGGGPRGGAGGGGGGSGAFLRTTLTVTPGASYDVVIGAGGNAGGGNGGTTEFKQGATLLASAAGGSGGAGSAGGAGGVSTQGAAVLARNGLNGSSAGALPPPTGDCTKGPPCQVGQGGAPGGAGGGPINGSVVPVGTTGGVGGSGGGATRIVVTVSQHIANASTGGTGTPGAPGYVLITW